MKYVLLFRHRHQANLVNRRKVEVEAESKGKAIELGRDIAADSKGVWKFEGVQGG